MKLSTGAKEMHPLIYQERKSVVEQLGLCWPGPGSDTCPSNMGVFGAKIEGWSIVTASGEEP